MVWIRDPEPSREKPPGMGIRFISLDSRSQKLVRWLIERNLSEGRPSFDL